MKPSMQSRHHPRGFSMIELMVTLAIIALVMALAAPSVGSSVKAARERSVEQKLIQDFTWARGAAGAADAGSLESGLSGAPLIEFLVGTDGTWTTTVKTATNSTGVIDAAHSMTSTALGNIATIACVGSPGLILPTTFKFSPLGNLKTATGTVTCTGSSGQNFPMNFIYSGSVFRTYGSTS